MNIPYYDTNEAAKLLKRRANTMRANYGKSGAVYGITPIKIGGRLHWPKDQVRQVMKGMCTAGGCR